MPTWIFSLIKEHRLSCYIRHNIRTVYRSQSFNNSFFLVGGGGGGYLILVIKALERLSDSSSTGRQDAHPCRYMPYILYVS